MPELPEVETIVREMRARLKGRCVRRVRVLRLDVVHARPSRRMPGLERLIVGRSVVDVRRRAKRALVELNDDITLVFRLGMTGRLTLADPGSVLETHTHLQIGFGAGQPELRFRDSRRFGGVWVLANGEQLCGPRLAALGPEPLTLTPLKFRQILQRNRTIKGLLLDQAIIAGIGNIYCDESLHAAGVDPTTPARMLGNELADALLRSIKRTLRSAIRARGTTLMDYRGTDGRKGFFRPRLKVYQRAGELCHTCGTVIRRIRVVGRSTFVCPNCQPTCNAEMRITNGSAAGDKRQDQKHRRVHPSALS